MTLDIEHNLSSDELHKALTGLAEASDISEAVIETLQKAHTCDDTPKVPRHPATRELYRRFQSEFKTAIRDIAGYADRADEMADELAKAIRSGQPLTAEQLRLLQQAIRDRFEFIAGQMQSQDYQPPAGLLERWQKLGLVSHEVTPQTFRIAMAGDVHLIQNAFVMGRLIEAVEAGKEYGEVMHLALTMPLKVPDLHAIAVAEQQTANYITNFGSDMATEAGNLWAKKQAETVRQMAIDYHGQTLQATVLDREKKEALGVEIPAKQVDTWRGFSSELYHAMGDKARDWDRIAFYELTDAQKQGQAHKLIEDVGPKGMVYKRPMPTACAQCKFLYLDTDGVTPKVFRLADLIENGINIGRKPHPVRRGKVAAGGREDGAETLKAVAGLVHPWCQCGGPYPVRGVEPWLKKS